MKMIKYFVKFVSNDLEYEFCKYFRAKVVIRAHVALGRSEKLHLAE